MSFYLEKRTWVRIVSFTLAVIAALAGGIMKESSRFASVERQLIYRYQGAMEDLTASMDSMAMTLEKSLYAGTAGGMNGLTSELVLQAGTAGAALSALPVGGESLQTLSKFISQVSDFCLVLSKKVTAGEAVSNEERDQLIKLSEIARSLSVQLEEAKTVYNSTQSWQASMDTAISDSAEVGSLAGSLTEAEESLSDYPTLIYDGPFSDHLTSRESPMLRVAGEVSREQAKKNGAELLGLAPAALTDAGEEEGNMPCYVFTVKSGRVSVTKRGGYVAYFRRERDIAVSELSYEQAVSAAKAFLDARQLSNFTESYYFTDEGVCVINFAYKQGKTVCYTDLIKIGVALDTGEIVFYEARGYIMNHQSRTLRAAKYSEAQAREVLSPYLKVQSVSSALIPSGGQAELYCYEFYCKGQQDEDVLVYINTETLAEEQLLVLLKTDGGTLTK